MTIVSLTVWSDFRTVGDEKDLLIVGAFSELTVTDCCAWVVLDCAAPSLPVTAPIAIVLSWEDPPTVEVTWTSMSHRPLAPLGMARGTVPPLRLIVPEPTTATTVPVVAKLEPSPAMQE